ncbi:Rad4-domain-containing protein [Pyrenochaeta sp. DS3sAY3a]|nr:Rad4-domain-containing protein [Pyrenochaeta sp. DS3sAY3a]
MAPARGKLHKTADSGTKRRSTRGSGNSQHDDVPEVFQEMLDEEQEARSSGANEDERPLKKRKTAQSQRTAGSSSQSQPSKRAVPRASRSSPQLSHDPSTSSAPPTTANEGSIDNDAPRHTRILQTIIDSDESDGSDMEWEDALGDGLDSDDEEEPVVTGPEIGDISIKIGGNKVEEVATQRRVRRRAITSVDKKRRLDIHKMHVLCLLYHVHRRNAWCNDRRTQSTLRKMVSPKILSNLVPDPTITQYSASKRFIDGMNDLKMLWSKRFKITAQGMYKPRWTEVEAAIRPFSDFDDLDDPMDKDDFRNAAHILQGSQDVGTQLFCTLLRAIGIEARLVCSLQPLPFASAAERATPQKAGPSKHTIILDPYNKPAEVSPTRPRVQTPSRPKKLSRLERIMGERHSVLNKTGVAPKKQKAYHTPYPVYWVEVFNSIYQKWVPIDTHSTFTVNSPEKLEPPLGFAQNSLTYAIAFDDDYTAKDVTRRYAKAYNAKTRKYRVECTPDGDKWYRKTMKFFKRSTTLDRDQVEDAALGRKEAAEGIPKNVQDFKGHPVYVLERHLRLNEVIHPMNQVGRVNCGTAMNPKMESIYRRSNVHLVRSSDKWYRMGRDVKEGEQPLRHAKPKKGARQQSVGIDMDMDEQMDEAGIGLYAEFQTELYIPPPIIKGRVPRNQYGNLDLYVPSMCPAGGTHIRHKLASKAARVVGVDFADAVTGFSFKGRHGTAIVQGVVVAQEYADAVTAVIEGMEYQQEESELAARSSEALRLWRRFYLGLRIAERVNAIEIDGEKGPTIDVQDEITRADKRLQEKKMAGGFFPDEAEADFAEPTGQNYQPPQYDHADYDGGGGFLPDDDEDEGVAGQTSNQPHPSATVNLNREHSFESSILDSQQLLPRRRSSLGDVYSSEDDDDDDVSGFIKHNFPTTDGTSTSKESGDPGVAFLKTTSELTARPAEPDMAGGFLTEDTKTVPEVTPARSPNSNITSAALSDKGKDVALESPPSSMPSDTGSLPLEDPEDEDADPDWLVEAT